MEAHLFTDAADLRARLEAEGAALNLSHGRRSRFVSGVRQRWPEKLWIVRHGQSAGNVARDAAACGRARRDRHRAARRRRAAVRARPASRRAALGRWFAALARGGAARGRPRPRLMSAPARPPRRSARRAGSPRRRASRSSTSGCASASSACSTGSPPTASAQKYPELAEQRALLGKFYHRAPGGESWADVILRLRSALDTISLHHADRRVLIVCHQVVVLCLRYILEELDEAQILAIDKEGDVVNCGVCEYEFEPDDAKALRAAAGPLQFRRAADRGGRAGHLRARRDGRGAMSDPARLDAELLRNPSRCPPSRGRRQGGSRAGADRRRQPRGARRRDPRRRRRAARRRRQAPDRHRRRASPSALGVAVPEARVIAGSPRAQDDCLAASGGR